MFNSKHEVPNVGLGRVSVLIQLRRPRLGVFGDFGGSFALKREHGPCFISRGDFPAEIC